MLYLLVHNLTATVQHHINMLNITTAESVYNILLSLLFHRFIYFLSEGKYIPKYFPKMFLKIFSFLRISQYMISS